MIKKTVFPLLFAQHMNRNIVRNIVVKQLWDI